MLLSSHTSQVAVENIDIGGPAMIRAAAKNHEHVTVVVDPSDYAPLLERLGGAAEDAAALAFRKRCAWKAFQHCATYDRCAPTCVPVGVNLREAGIQGSAGQDSWLRMRLWLMIWRARAAGACLKQFHCPFNTHTQRPHLSIAAACPPPQPCRSTVAEWLWGAVGEGPAPEMSVPMKLAQGLRYGENPHQSAAYYTDSSLAGG